MEDYKGKNRKERYETYKTEGLKSLSSLTQGEILFALSRYCIGKELITPELKKNGRSLEEFIEAQKEFGSSDESLLLFIGEFIALDDCPKNISSIMDMRMRLNNTYTIDQLVEIGKSYNKFFL